MFSLSLSASIRGSILVRKHHDQKQAGDERVYFVIQLGHRGQGHHGRPLISFLRVLSYSTQDHKFWGSTTLVK